MAAAASNGTASKAEMKYPELEEQALQFILDCCESSISKYTKFIEVINFFIHSKCVCLILFKFGMIVKNYHLLLFALSEAQSSLYLFSFIFSVDDLEI